MNRVIDLGVEMFLRLHLNSTAGSRFTTIVFHGYRLKNYYIYPVACINKNSMFIALPLPNKFVEKSFVEIVSHRVINESLFDLWLPLCLITKHHIFVPPPFESTPAATICC